MSVKTMRKIGKRTLPTGGADGVFGVGSRLSQFSVLSRCFVRVYRGCRTVPRRVSALYVMASEADRPSARSSAIAQVMIQSLTQPVAANVFESFRDNEAVLQGAPRVGRDNVRYGSLVRVHARLNDLAGSGQNSDLVLAKDGIHNPVEVHDHGIAAA